ncbi:MAG: GIY-YIG nuclease family protein [Flavobacteriales bacterium]|jgi:putative endonuclease
MYILRCSDETFYTGSTVDLSNRILEHQSGMGCNYTRKRLPVVLVYFEYFNRIEDAFNREKQIQKWSSAKKQALINGKISNLKSLASCQNLTHFAKRKKPT